MDLAVLLTFPEISRVKLTLKNFYKLVSYNRTLDFVSRGEIV